MRQKMALMLAMFPIAIMILIASVLTSSSSAYLRMNTPKPGKKIAAGSFLTITGESTPSNATHTRCNVQLQINQQGYKPVTPLGPSGTYTGWKITTVGPVKGGLSFIDGHYTCFPPTGTTPNFIKHIIHNFTGIQTGIQTIPANPMPPFLPH
jgi:hypothetical protein